MKKYMVITVVDGEQGAAFFDDQTAAEQYRMNCECGVGGYAQVYRYIDGKYGGKYVFMYE